MSIFICTEMSVKARPVFTGKQTVRNLSRSVAQTETEEWSLFPRQREGNIYAHNWSLCEDGVVPEGDAYRNARLPIITTEMRAKINEGKIEQTKPQYFGNYKVNESGDDMSHEIFSELFSAQQQYLSSGINLFVEDAILGSHSQMRNGVRITTSIPAVALIARSLLVSTFSLLLYYIHIIITLRIKTTIYFKLYLSFKNIKSYFIYYIVL